MILKRILATMAVNARPSYTNSMGLERWAPPRDNNIIINKQAVTTSSDPIHAPRDFNNPFRISPHSDEVGRPGLKNHNENIDVLFKT